MSKKPKGWCKENGVEHAWQDGPVLTVNPPIYTRVCINCGQQQRMAPRRWEDYPPDEKKGGGYVHG